MFSVKTKMNDLPVSLVSGVILIVTVIAILTAVIGSFVFGLDSNVEQEPQAEITFDHDRDTVTVEVVSMSNEDYLTVKVDGAGSLDTSTFSDAGDSDTVDNNLVSVGESGKVTGLSEGSTVTVVGTLDGTESVVAELFVFWVRGE